MAGTGTAHLRAEPALLRVEHLVVEYPGERGQVVHAVSDVSFDILPGETLGLVGESGCGKSTTGRAVLQLPRPTAGTVSFDGQELSALVDEQLRQQRPKIQMILQDPISSLNERRKVKELVGEGLRVWGMDRRTVAERVDRILDDVGLDPEVVGDRRPRSFSGGQCQRICIARAVALEPKLIVCDEPVSALDVSVQAQILNLLETMKQKHDLTLLFITHDLSVVKNVSDRIIVMYLGRICEVGRTESLFASPTHPYTQLLLESVPRPDPTHHRERMGALVTNDLPSPVDPPSGCRFRTRCPLADERCRTVVPTLRRMSDDHFVACHHADGVKASPVAMVETAASRAG